MSIETLEKGKAIAPVQVNSKLAVKGDPNGFRSFLASKKNLIQGVAAKHMDANRITKIVLQCVTKTPKLMECSMESILRSTLQACEMGLEPGSATGEGYLVPYKGTCTFIPGYRGLISLAYRSGFVVSICARCVYQSDKFDYREGLNPVLDHVPNPETRKEPKDITYVYCIVHLKDGGMLYDVMSRGEVDAIRGRSAAGGSGPWTTDYAEMARKTVVRRCLKYAPMSVEMAKAVALDDAIDSGESLELAEFDFEGEIVPEVETQAKTGAIKDMLPEAPSEAQASLVDPETGEVVSTKPKGIKDN